MKKNNIDPANKQQGGITDKQDKNAGSGAFQQGAQQDEHYNDGVAALVSPQLLEPGDH